MENSPTNHVTELCARCRDVDILVVVGQYDCPEFHRQSQDFDQVFTEPLKASVYVLLKPKVQSHNGCDSCYAQDHLIRQRSTLHYLMQHHSCNHISNVGPSGMLEIAVVIFKQMSRMLTYCSYN